MELSLYAPRHRGFLLDESQERVFFNCGEETTRGGTMKNKKKILALLLAMTMVITAFAGCASNDDKEETQNDAAKESIILATTTSTQDSGLLDYLLPIFKEKTGYDVDVIAVGSGDAMTMGENGEADVLLVHSPAAEKEFIEAGHGPERFDVMYNDFVLVGPNEDPLNIATDSADNVQAAFQKIYDSKTSKFLSRADKSGTHSKELSIWEKLGITPTGTGDWYVETGKGMGDVITMTNEMLGYTLADRATWLKFADKTDLKIVTEGDKDMFNQYGVIVVDPAKNENINSEGALAFQTWILSKETQKLIKEFGIEEFGQALFTPNAAM